jgi:hypothetical protein
LYELRFRMTKVVSVFAFSGAVFTGGRSARQAPTGG